jgi:hypothetical protein
MLNKPASETDLWDILVRLEQHNSVTKFIGTIVANLVTPEASHKDELLFNKLASDSYCQGMCNVCKEIGKLFPI